MITLALEALLLVLLVAASLMCWRLDRRLNALRSGQDGMREAVIALSEATARAEAGVAQLQRSGSATAKELESRIEEAQRLAAHLHRLERARPAHSSPFGSDKPARFRTAFDTTDDAVLLEERRP